jgi:dTMP kinase
MPTSTQAGRFIVFEGIDGAGTTTQVHRYAQHVRRMRRLVHLTREPSDGPIGALLRLALAGRTTFAASSLAQTMALLFAADRLDHLTSEILPYLGDGAVVLSDRYDLSSIAYQWASAGKEASHTDFRDWLRSLNRYARRPDVTVVLDVSPEKAEQRRRERHGAAELYEVASLQVRLAELYRDAEQLVPGDSIVHIDGDQEVDQVTAAVVEALAPFVGR